MAKAGNYYYWMMNYTIVAQPQKNKSFFLSPPLAAKINQSHQRNEISFPLISKKKSPRRLVKISTSDGRWQGKWNMDYLFSLRDLQLQDLADDDDEDGHKNAQVSINLSIQKHASFGLSVDGRIITSFTRKCSNCSSPYCREIDTKFNVWVLPSSRNRDTVNELPEIGGDDPSVIYVKPGSEADIDSLIQDAIRLATSVKETCSETCEKSEPKLQHIGAQNAASLDRRWSRLLELRKAHT